MNPALVILGVVALLAVVTVLVFVWRLRSIGARVGSFQCALRTGARWLPGIAMYTVDHLVWYDVVSLSRQPRYRWGRCDLMILERHVRTDPAHGRPVVEARCVHEGQQLDIAAEPAAFEGLVSWLEASPPGARNHTVI